ncbi:Gfo/Idh/MocA family oxidoreductase [bacterium]|nr:Gfo/Idh/MocA family oxidoreductase [bacterium]
MSEKIRWGIVGTGGIAQAFAAGLSVLEDAELVGVASRTMESANRFGEKFNVPNRHVGTEALAADPDVDVVYIGTPHSMHKSDTLTCLNGGKAVLCEKPFAMNVAEAEEMIESAKSKGLFLMEAMWMYFFPMMRRVREIIASGTIGEVLQVQSNFCFRAERNPEGRLFSPALGGGALLDLGIYNVALGRMVFDRDPESIVSAAHIGPTGVDEHSSIIMTYDNGGMATGTQSISITADAGASIYGTKGSIKILPGFWNPDRIFVNVNGRSEEELVCERTGNGYNYEAEEVMQCLSRGAVQSEVISWELTLANMRILDECRRQWGMTYPMEEA